jgi:multiple sugar transport system substrate-binding protein
VARALIAFLALCAAAPTLRAQELVTPVRVGRPEAATTLTVWAQQDYSHLAARPAIAGVFTDVFADWARAHPDVQLRVSVMPALELHKAKLQLAAAAGRLPDVASIDSFWMPLLADAVQPLDEFWPAEDRRDFLPFTIRTLSDPAGHLLGMWHETDCRVLFYRKDLVPVPPATWDALLDVASRVARERHIAGYVYNAGRWEATVFDHLAMFWAQGGELVDRDGRPIFGEGANRRAMLRLLSFLRDTIERGASPRSVLGHNDYQQLTGAAVAGDAAMFLGGNWQLKDLESGLSPAEFAKWDIAPIPTADAGTHSTGTGGWVWVVFAKDPARRKAAVEFIRDVEAPAHAARISAATGHLPVRRSVYRDFPIFSQDVWYRRFGELAAAPARHRRRRLRRTHAGAGARCGVVGGERRVRATPFNADLDARNRWRSNRLAAARCSGPVSDCAARSRTAQRPRHRRLAAPGTRACDRDPDLPDARSAAAVADRRDRCRHALRVHDIQLSHAHRRPGILRDDRRHGRVRRRVGDSPADDRLRGRVAD